ncbi:MAG TPA: hypothetical protein PLV25_02650 [Opitutales bacterium]|nr:hypothetical protein [Opitutales bacterium]
MDSRIQANKPAFSPPETPQQGWMSKLMDMLRQLVGLKPAMPIEQLYIYDYKNGGHVATGLSQADFTLLSAASPAVAQDRDSEAVAQADKLLRAAGYDPSAKNAPAIGTRLAIAQLLAEGKVNLQWTDAYTKALNNKDQLGMEQLLKAIRPPEHVVPANEPDPVYGEELVFLTDLITTMAQHPQHMEHFDWSTSFGLRVAKDAFRNDGTLFEGALKEARDEMEANTHIPYLKTPHSNIVLKRINELLENTHGLQDKLMAIEAPKDQNGPMAKVIRETLGLAPGAFVTDGLARRAALSGLLSELRQDDHVGSCFATAPASMILEDHPTRFLEDFAHMCATNTLAIRSGTATRYIPVNARAPAPKSPEAAALVGPKRNRVLDAWQYTLASFSKATSNDRIRDEICSGVLGYGSSLGFSKMGTPSQRLFNTMTEILKNAGLSYTWEGAQASKTSLPIETALRAIYAQIEFLLHGQLYPEYNPTLKSPPKEGAAANADTQSTMGTYTLKRVSVDAPYGPQQQIETIEQLQDLLNETIDIAFEDPFLAALLPQEAIPALKAAFKEFIDSPNFAQDFATNIQEHTLTHYSVQEGKLTSGRGGNSEAVLESTLGLGANTLKTQARKFGAKDYHGQDWKDVKLTPAEAYGHGLSFIESIINGLKAEGVRNTDQSYVCSGFGHTFRLRPGLDADFWQAALDPEGLSTEEFVTEQVHKKIEAFNNKPIEEGDFENWAAHVLSALGLEGTQHDEALNTAIKAFKNMDSASRIPWKVYSLLGENLPEAQKNHPTRSGIMQSLFMQLLTPPKIVFADSNWKSSHGNTYYTLAYNPIIQQFEFWDAASNSEGQMSLVEDLGADWLHQEYTFYAPQELKGA